MSQPDVVEVVLVEDQVADAQLILRALRAKNLGNNVLWLRDGAQALEFLLRSGRYAEPRVERHLKLVLLDVKLPKVDGIEVLQAIRATAELRSLPVVMLTSSPERLTENLAALDSRLDQIWRSSGASQRACGMALTVRTTA